MFVRGIRGAVQAEENTRDAILQATANLLRAICRANNIPRESIAAAFFTMTHDLNAEFPARAARDMGWTSVPLICSSEIDVPGSMKKVIRALILVNTDKGQGEFTHCYMGKSAELRKDMGMGLQ